MTSQHDKAKRWRREDWWIIAILVPFGFLLSLPIGRDIGFWGYLIGPAISVVVGLLVARHVPC